MSKKKIKPYNLFWCETCNKNKSMTFEECKAHLESVHGLKTKEQLKGSREMLMHMDGREWFSSKYKFTFKTDRGAIELLNESLCLRDDDDMMRYA